MKEKLEVKCKAGEYSHYQRIKSCVVELELNPIGVRWRLLLC